jgi:4a-hydroxytetrahydrobiopterin dehydratase
MFASTALKRIAVLSKPTARNFALLVPVTRPQKELPMDVQTTPLSDEFYGKLAAEYAAFNDNCKNELQEMNKNIIENIVDRGGNDGWDTTEDRMTKAFEFSSFEQCQAFCTAVSMEANKKDHHPEWKVTNGGNTVEVTLTSHFAGNKVTRLDFELAEEMN